MRATDQADAGSAEGQPAGRRSGPRALLVKRLALLSATTLVALNIWTGVPLLALWVGSRVVGQQTLSMGAVFVVVAVMAVLEVAMAYALTWLSATYDELVGRQGARRVSPWLQSMRAEQHTVVQTRRGTTAVELIVIGMTVVAILAFEAWFFFLAGSPLG